MNLRKFTNKVLLVLLLSFVGIVGYAANISSTATGGNWSDGTSWSGGVVPGPGDDVTIVAGATITLDQDVTVNSLTVNGSLVIGNNATARSLTVGGTTTVGSGGSITVGSFDITHSITFQGTVTNNGTINLRNSSSQVANVTFDGTFTVGGSNTPQFNNVTFTNGTITAGVAFDINGAVTIEDGATFADGGYTHTVAGNWTENGTGQMTGNGTIVMDASLIQSVTADATFYNLTYSGGGTGVIAGNVTVINDFSITGNTEVKTSQNIVIQGNFSVADGSKFTASAGTVTMNSSNAQSITIGTTNGEPNVTFQDLYLDNGGSANPKTVTGNIVSNGLLYIYSDAQLDEAVADTYVHQLHNFRVDGTCNFSGTIQAYGGTFYDDDDNDFTVGTADIVVFRSLHTQGGDIMRVNGNITVGDDSETYGSYLDVINNSQLIGTNAKTLLVKSGKSLYIRGSDNFPSGFGTVTFETGSFARYSADITQTIQDVNNGTQIQYANLYLAYNTKTANGNLDINGNLYLYHNVDFQMGSYSHTIAGHIVNTSDSYGNGSLTSTGTVTLDAVDADQYVYNAGTGTYTFENLVITLSAPTAAHFKRFYDDITVNGNFTATNTGGNSTNLLYVNIYENTISGSGNTFSLGSNVVLRTSGQTNFENSMSNFSTKSLDINSTVRFERNVSGSQQWIPNGFTYGNVQLYGNNVKTLRGNTDIDGDITAVGYTPVLTDNSNTIYVQGDWKLHLNNTDLTGTNIVVFDGTDQNINDSHFSYVYFNNSGTKTIQGTLDILHDLNIATGVTVETSHYIYIEGNWVENGTGQFHQTRGITTFDGTTANQTITAGSNSYFYSFYIDKPNANKTVTLNSDIDINGTFNFIENNAVFDMNGYDIHVARDFYFREGCTFNYNNGKVYFDGNDVAQLIRNYNPAILVFGDVEFSGTAVKRLYNNSFRFKGDVTINNSTLDGQWWDHYVEGDWINNGIFRHSATLHFDGAQDQSISQSDFHSVRFGGGNYTKTLNGNIKLTGNLYIDDATLDVSANNYDITLDNNWYNDSTGSFIARNGTVTINGEYSYLFTGESNTQYGSGSYLTTQGGTKSFYNLVINKSDDVYYIMLRGDLHVDNNFIINGGDFRKSYDPNNYGINDITVKGDFIVKGRYRYNGYGSTLTLSPASGTHTFDPGDANLYEEIYFSGAAGTTYDFASNLTCGNDKPITINNGTINLNSHSITTNGSGGDITLNAGTLNLDSAAFISMGNDATFLNAGGNFILVGHVDDPASLVATSGNYTFTQTAGSISAQYFRVEGTKGNGLDIQGGSLDATNTFQNGSFSGGTGTAYISISGIDLGGDRTIENTTFNSGPTYNVQRTSGNGEMNFVNASGTLAGEDYDNDPASYVNWSYPGVAFWDGDTDGDGDGLHWNDPLNWVADAVPTNTSNVVLDHGAVTGAYTVEISTADAVAKSILITSGSNTITLKLDGHTLTVAEDITIGSNSVLTQTNAGDKITLGGSWANEGTFNEGTATVEFNPTTGTHTIITQGAGDAFYNVIFNGTGGTNIISSTLDIDGDVLIQGGTVSAGSHTITVAGNWTKTGGAFDYGTSTVIFDNAGNQSIAGGEFYNFKTSNSGTKTATANIDINNDITIGSGTVFDGGTNIIYVGDDWTNEVGNAGFTQTGSGTVIFDGETSVQDIGSTSTMETTFNNVTISGTTTKYTRKNVTINGNLNITSAALYIVDGTTIDGAGGSNELNMSRGIMYINGANNFPQNFETINLTGGTVDYYADIDQTIYPTSYYHLRMRHIWNSGVATTKTLGGDIDVKGSIYVGGNYDDETTFDVDNHTITLIGGLSIETGAPQISWGANGTLIHYGTYFTVDADITTFNNVIKKNRGYFRVAYNDLNITGDFSIIEDAYLRQENVLINCTGANKTFTLGPTAYIDEYVTETLGASTNRKAFPTNFATYDLHKDSRVYFRGTDDQLVYTTPTYGNVYIYTNAEIDVMLDGDWDIDGSFYMSNDAPTLVDNGHNINVAGANIDLRTYIPTPGTIFTLDGENQRLYDNAHGASTIDLANVVFAGSGQKDLTCGGDDYYRITENLTINSGVTVYSNRKIDFSGQNWTNNGTFNHTSNTVYFTRAGNQTIDPGADNDFYSVSFSGGNTKTFVNNGIDVNNGTFTIENSTTVDMGNGLTHYIASERITNNGGTWTTDNANFVFDRNETQYLPAMTAQNITLRKYDQWTRVRILEGALNINDLNIEEGVQLRCSASDDASTPAYNVTMTGNFINNGYLYAWGNTFKFESNNTDPKTIKMGGGYFHNVTFNQSLLTQNARTYTLTEETRFYEDLTIGKNATLDLNGQILHLGNDDPNDPVEPNAEEHLIQADGKLIVDAGASLQFSCRDVGNPKLTVEGTLEIVGTSGNNAVITADGWYSNSHRIDIDVTTGTIAAEYYLIQYLTDDGLKIGSSATIDPTHNLSNGTFSEMNTSTSGTHYYLSCDADVTGIGTIDNVTFNFATTPTQGVHFNVKRSAGSTGVMTFGGTSSGLLAGEFYEADPTGVNNTGTSLIEWPPVTEVYWTGNVSTDWFDPLNWSPNVVPDANRSAIIPLRSNNPIITGANAECLDLKITDGFLTMQSGWDLKVYEDVYIGIGTDVGILAIEDPNCAIEVVGDWTRGANAVFVHGNGTVNFTASGGNVSITPRSSAFYNVTFNGGATFMIASQETYVDGDLTITNGTVSPSLDNYNIYIKGDYNNAGGTFSNVHHGTVYFDGSGDQTITNGAFWNVTIDGSGTKTTVNACTIDGNLDVKNATFKGGAPIDMNNYVTIEATGTFDDGGYTHTFSGYRWTGTGGYVGTGVIEFDRNGTQYIKPSKFNSLLLKNNGPVILEGNVDVTGDVSLIEPNMYLNVQTYTLNNTSGSGTFSMADARRIYVRGANNYPSGFSVYDLDRNSYSIYDGSMTQTIAPVPITYGRLYLNNGPKILGGHLDIDGFLYLYDDASLDVTTNNYRINIAGSWYNRYGATFEPREGEVIFDGNDDYTYMFIYEASKNTNPFYKLTINKGNGEVRTYWTDITVRDNLRVLNGVFYTSKTIYVGGDLAALSGTFATAGTYYLNKPSGTANVLLNGSVLYNLTINAPNTTYYLQDDLDMHGNFNLIAGTFDANGKTVKMGDYGEVQEISGIYKIQPGGKLLLPNYATLKVNSGGEIYVVGSAFNTATVSNITGRYYFNIENGGKIYARNYLFEFMAENGVYIKDGGIIDNDYNFSYGTFANPANGGSCLRIENNQDLTEANGHPIVEVSFPFNPGGGAHNVTKTVASAGTVDFKDYSGEFAGEDYDNDPNDLINWVSPPYIMWTGNIDNDWFKIGNWEVTSGPDRIPLITDNVIITKRLNQPLISVGGSAVAKSIDLQENAILTLNTSSAAGTTLEVADDVSFTGTLTMTTQYDILEVGGNWNNAGTFNAGQGTVIMNSRTGTKSIDNLNDEFYNLTIDAASSIQLIRNTTVDNNLTVSSGTLDLTANNRQLTVKGSFYNNSNVETHYGKIVLAGQATTTYDFKPGSSDYYTIDISAGTSSIYRLTSDLSLTHNMNVNSGTLKLNGKTFNLGDANGTDVLTIAGGTVHVDANSFLMPANSASVEVNNNGVLKIVGTDVDNPGAIHSQSGEYAVNINSGGTIHAQFYDIQNTNINGINLKPGATIDATDNFSYGTFRNGNSAGQYIWLQNDFADFTAKEVYFHGGASVNVKRLSGTGVVTFEDALGSVAGPDYENDNPPHGATDGKIHWTYTHQRYIWVGGVSSDWNDPNNWNVSAPHLVPTSNDIAVIPDIDESTHYNPILNSGADGNCYDLDIQTGGFLTIANNKNMDVDNCLVVASGGTLTVSSGSLTDINVADIYLMEGTFNHGGSSTVIFDAPAGKILALSSNSNFYNLTINSSGVAEYTTGTSLKIDGTFNINNGVFTVSDPADTIYVGKDWINNATFNNGNGIVVFNGSGAQSITNSGTGDFYNVSFNGTGTTTLLSDVVVENDLKINTYATLSGGTKMLTLYGDWTNRGTFVPGTGTVYFHGTKPQLINNYNNETFYNFTLNNSATSFPQVILYSDLRLLSGSTWTMTDGIFETSSHEMLHVEDNVTLVGGNTDASYVSGPITKEGDDDFVFPIGDGNVFARLGLDIDNTGTATFVVQYHNDPYSDVSNVAAPLNHVSGSEYWTIERTSGSENPILTLYWEDGSRSGIDNLSTLTTALYVGSQWEDRGQASVTGTVLQGTITANTPITTFGAFTFASLNTDNPLNSYNFWTGEVSTQWENPNNWTKGVPTNCMNSLIPADPANQPVINSDAEVGQLIINENASLTIKPLKSLTANRKLYINGSLTLESDNTGNASLINKSAISYGPNCHVTEQLYLSAGQYHYVSAPMQSVHSDRFKEDHYPSGNPNFYYYYEPGSTWNILNADWFEFTGNMGIMEGYAYYGDQDLIIGLTRAQCGNFNTGDKSKNLIYTGNTEVYSGGSPYILRRGWNFVGNPYPAYLDWDSTYWTKSNIYNSIYFWNGTNYSYYVISDGAQDDGLGTNNGTSIIPPMQGYFVKVKEDPANPDNNQTGLLVTPEAARTTATHAFYKANRLKSKTETDVIRLTVEGNGHTDETAIRFLPQATSAFDDNYDAFKLFPDPYYGVPQIYSVLDSNIIASINTLPQISDNLVIPLGFRAEVAGVYTITSNDINFSDYTEAWFEDLQENKVYDLQNLDYTFYSEEGQFENRFRIIFSLENTSIDEQNVGDVNILVYPNPTDGVFTVVSPNEAILNIEIIDATGKTVKTQPVNGDSYRFNLYGYSAGVYSVKVKTETGVKLEKVIIQ